MNQIQQKILLQVLKKGQEKFGYLAKEFTTEVAKSWNIPESELHELVISFPFLRTQPQGRNVIIVCKGKPCFIREPTIMEAIRGEIGIGPGETTPDGKFSIEMVNCLSVCDQAPAIKINGDLYVEMTTRKVAQILKRINEKVG